MTRETRNLLIFFAATFAWTWAFYIPIALDGHSRDGSPRVTGRAA